MCIYSRNFPELRIVALFLAHISLAVCILPAASI